MKSAAELTKERTALQVIMAKLMEKARPIDTRINQLDGEIEQAIKLEMRGK